MNLTLVPFGNAKIQGGKVSCQHGTKECAGNRYEQCGIAHNPDPKKHFPFYYCLEKSKGKPNFKSAAQTCAKSAGLDFDAIQTCWSGDEGTALQKKYADLTPTHKYTPWVTLNTVPTSQRGSFLSQLCKKYVAGGGTAPKGCKKALEEKEPYPAEW